VHPNSTYYLTLGSLIFWDHYFNALASRCLSIHSSTLRELVMKLLVTFLPKKKQLALDRHGLGDVRRVCPWDAHHDPQDYHSSCWQAQPTLRTDHLLDQSTPFHRALTRRWGVANCLRMCRLNAGCAADTNI
jgi:hypothetical protein